MASSYPTPIRSNRPHLTVVKSLPVTRIPDNFFDVCQACGAAAAGLYMVMRRWTGDDGVCRISYGDLAERCGASRRHVIRLVASLIEGGFVASEPMRDQRGGHAPNEFTFPGTPSDIEVWRSLDPSDRPAFIEPYPSDTMEVSEADPSDTTNRRFVTTLVTDPSDITPHTPRSTNVVSSSLIVEKKENVTPPISPPAVKAETTQRKRRLPDDFAVTAEMREWARGKGIADADIDDQTEKFKAHHGFKGTLGIDWRKGWQTWMGNALEWRHVGPSKNGRAPSPRSAGPPPPMVERGKAPSDGGLAAWRAKGKAR